MSNPADTGTSREGDPYAEIAALKQRVAELERDIERERNAHAGTAGSHARLRAELAAVTKELEAARKVCEELDWVPLHNPPSDGLESALAAYRATQTKEPSDE